MNHKSTAEKQGSQKRQTARSPQKHFHKRQQPVGTTDFSSAKTTLNAFEVQNADELNWPVALYNVERVDGNNEQAERGALKSLIWDLRNLYSSTCPGYGFVVDVDAKTIAIPAKWEIPRQDNHCGYRVRRAEVFVAQARNKDHAAVVSGILRESIKKHFKDKAETDLGKLWQNFNDFCEAPPNTTGSGKFLFCRRYQVSSERLCQGQWVIQFSVSTACIDGRTVADYYDAGEVSVLAERIKSKQDGRLTRDNQPTAVRILRQSGINGFYQYQTMDLNDPDAIIKHAQLEPADQRNFGMVQKRVTESG